MGIRSDFKHSPDDHTDDHSLAKNMLNQMAAAIRDAVSLLWPVVRSAWAVSMTDIEEGRLSWADSMQWSLNRISNSQLAIITPNLSTLLDLKPGSADILMRDLVQVKDIMGLTNISVISVINKDVPWDTQKLGVSIAIPATFRKQSHLEVNRCLVDPWTTLKD